MKVLSFKQLISIVMVIDLKTFSRLYFKDSFTFFPFSVLITKNGNMHVNKFTLKPNSLRQEIVSENCYI